MGTVLLAIATVALLYGCCFSDWAKKDAAERAAQERVDAKPHIVADSGDGCFVYAFKRDDATHYFTRCKDGTVTTDRNYSERHGKVVEHKTETIVTERDH